MTTSLSCRQIVDFVDAYRTGALAPAERLRFEGHLAECPECRDYLAAYAQAVGLSKEAIGEGSGADAIPEALVRAILASRQPH